MSNRAPIVLVCLLRLAKRSKITYKYRTSAQMLANQNLHYNVMVTHRSISRVVEVDGVAEKFPNRHF